MSKCLVDGCDADGKLRRGMCNKHYTRQYRTGDAATVRPPGRQGEGRSSHPMYGAWAAMLNRCSNPNNSSYGRYGAVGVSVCERWRDDFLNFLADMGERPEGMTLDRIDPRGPYSPENCRWATPSVQRANVDPEKEEAARKVNSEKKTAYWRAVRTASAAPSEAVE